MNIKNYKQFLEYLNERVNLSTERDVKREIETAPVKPMPKRPSIVPSKEPSIKDKPLASTEKEQETKREVETPERIRPKRPSIVPSKEPRIKDKPLAVHENKGWNGDKLMQELADMLGVENAEEIDYKGKKICFYSETNSFHVDGKKFKSVEDVYNYLTK